MNSIFIPFTGIVRSRVSRTLEKCVDTTSVGIARINTPRPVILQIKEKVQDKVLQILRNIGGK